MKCGVRQEPAQGQHYSSALVKSSRGMVWDGEGNAACAAGLHCTCAGPMCFLMGMMMAGGGGICKASGYAGMMRAHEQVELLLLKVVRTSLVQPGVAALG